jgi:hypothetical protein
MFLFNIFRNISNALLIWFPKDLKYMVIFLKELIDVFPVIGFYLHFKLMLVSEKTNRSLH